MQPDNLYGTAIVRPELVAGVRGPSKDELRAIKWHRFKSEVKFLTTQALLITASAVCFAYVFVTLVASING